MKFSIITPSYNQGKYIKETLDSVLSLQSDCLIEHIVIDGSSQDETVSILKNYSDIYPNLIWSSCRDRGQSDALNKGLKRATGEIIAYINSDDYYIPGTFKRVLDIFEKYPEVDFVYGDIFLVNSSGKVLRRVSSLRTSLWRHLYSFGFPQQSCFWRRRIGDLVPEFNINNKTCMDAEYFAHILTQQITFCRLSEPLACFRVHDDSLTWSGRMKEVYVVDRQNLQEKFKAHSSYLPLSYLMLLGKLVKYYSLLIRPEWEFFKAR